MPLHLSERATRFGDLALANNDIVFELHTPASMLEVQSIPTAALKASAREFSRRTETAWDAFIYFVPQDKRNDRVFVDSAKADYHIHMFATLFFAGGLRIDRLLPKSGHDKGDYRVNLADAPLGEWATLVGDMSHRTQIAVERFRIHYVERFLETVPG
jgi:hypothetical protein